MIKLRTPEITYHVAPWFPEGPGGTSSHGTEAEALATRDRLVKLGYPKVRVWMTIVEWIAHEEAQA